MMIPHIIHYCWFGGSELPKSAKRCIASWKKYFPDYEIKEWNEENFDVHGIPYTHEAYERRKYAFVSDYARFYILYHHGGLYFDTDVEIIRPMKDIVELGAFMGIEKDCELIGVNPGLGMGSAPQNAIYKEILSYYETLHYIDENGNPYPGTVVSHVTKVLQRHGLELKNEMQEVAGIRIYPNDYFNPLDDATGRLCIKGNTHSIHWYAKTWLDNYGPLRTWATRWMHRIFGINSLQRFKRYIHI